MSEIWAASAITVGGSLLSGLGASKRDRANKLHDKEMVKENATWSAALSQFEREQEDYYQQLNRQRKQRGLDQFRQFSQVKNFAPGYQDNSNRVVLPDKPDYKQAFGTEPQRI